MTPASDRSRKVADLFNDALECPVDERAGFVERAAGPDSALRTDVFSLIDAHEAADVGFLELEAGDELPTIGPYRLLDELGRGGQAVVYRAVDTRTDRRVALKLLSSPLAWSTESARRLLRESTAIARVDDPGICEVFDAGRAEGLPYIAMRLVDGVSLAGAITAAGDGDDGSSLLGLARCLQTAPGEDDSEPTEEDALRRIAWFFERAARAIHAAHAAGLVHRDVKPGNIMIETGGAPIIVDFGLARELEGASRLTRSGDVIGTPEYIAPELLAGDASADARTDVYSLGVGLYEATTSVRPFRAPTREALFRRIASGDAADPRGLCPSLDRPLAAVIGTAMAREPRRRYRTAAELADDLARWRKHEPVHARRPGIVTRLRNWTRRNPSAAAVMLGVLLVAFGALIATLSRLGEVERKNVEIAAALRAARASGLASAAADVGRRDPMLGLLLAREAVRLIESPETVSRLHAALAGLREKAVFSGHDGPIISARFAREGGVTTLSGAGVRRVFGVDGSPGCDAVQEIEGGRIRVTTRMDLQVSRVDESVRRLRDPGGDLDLRIEGFAPIACADVALDGSFVAVAARDGTAALIDREGKRLLDLGGHRHAIEEIRISPDGSVIATRTRRVVSLWNRSGERRATWNGHADWIRSLHFSPDGRSLVTASSDQSVALWDLDGDLKLRYRGHAAAVEVARFSPDGNYVVSGSYDQTARVWDLEGRDIHVFHGHRATVTEARFSADGRFVLTASDDRTARMWNLRDPALPRLVGHRLGIFSARYSAEGDLIATSSRDGTARLWRASGELLTDFSGHEGMVYSAIPLADGRILSTGWDYTARFWSRDGKQLHCVSSETGRFFGEGAFSASGGLLLTRHKMNEVRIVDLEGRQRALLSGHAAAVWSAAFTDDGRYVVTASGDRTARIWDLEGRCLRVLEGHDARLRAARFSHAGDFVVTASDDGSACVFDIDGGIISRLEGHQGEVLHVDVSPDDRRIVTASRDRTARLWDRVGRPIAVLAGHDGVVWSASFSPSGDRVITASSDRTVRTWLADVDELKSLADRCVRAFTASERERFSGLLDNPRLL